jgi:hypothetical protein
MIIIIMTTYKLDCNKIIKLLNNGLYTSSLKTKIVFLHYTGRYNWQRDNETHMHAFLTLFENFNITRGRGGAGHTHTTTLNWRI